jgi:hypothetical protein
VVAFERAAVRLTEVVHCHHVTGNYDYLLQVEVADLPAYEDFHANRLAGLPGVAAVTSYVTMKRSRQPNSHSYWTNLVTARSGIGAQQQAEMAEGDAAADGESARCLVALEQLGPPSG